IVGDIFMDGVIRLAVREHHIHGAGRASGVYLNICVAYVKTTTQFQCFFTQPVLSNPRNDIGLVPTLCAMCCKVQRGSTEKLFTIDDIPKDFTKRQYFHFAINRYFASARLQEISTDFLCLATAAIHPHCYSWTGIPARPGLVCR